MRKVKATSIVNPVYRTVLVTEGLTQVLEVVKNSIRGLYIQQFEIHMHCIFFFFFFEKMAKCLANVSKWLGLCLGLTGSEQVSHSQARPTASWGHSVGQGGGGRHHREVLPGDGEVLASHPAPPWTLSLEHGNGAGERCQLHTPARITH